MPRFSASLSFLFTEVPFLERFAAARAAGFTAVEYMFPYDYPPGTLAQALQEHGLEQVLFNLPAGDWAAGERGIAILPDRRAEFRDGVRRARDYARVLGVRRINCLVGVLPPGLAPEQAEQVLIENLRFAAEELAADGLMLLVEPVNDRDIPGFFLTSGAQALAVLEAVGAPNLRLQYDVYHAARMGEDPLAFLQANLPRIGHVQIADAPGRHQPGTGRLDLARILGELDRLGYSGYVGLEYVPEPDTLSSLGWLARYR